MGNLIDRIVTAIMVRLLRYSPAWPERYDDEEA